MVRETAEINIYESKSLPLVTLVKTLDYSTQTIKTFARCICTSYPPHVDLVCSTSEHSSTATEAGMENSAQIYNQMELAKLKLV